MWYHVGFAIILEYIRRDAILSVSRVTKVKKNIYVQHLFVWNRKFERKSVACTHRRHRRRRRHKRDPTGNHLIWCCVLQHWLREIYKTEYSHRTYIYIYCVGRWRNKYAMKRTEKRNNAPVRRESDEYTKNVYARVTVPKIILRLIYYTYATANEWIYKRRNEREKLENLIGNNKEENRKLSTEHLKLIFLFVISELAFRFGVEFFFIVVRLQRTIHDSKGGLCCRCRWSPNGKIQIFVQPTPYCRQKQSAVFSMYCNNKKTRLLDTFFKFF